MVFCFFHWPYQSEWIINHIVDIYAFSSISLCKKKKKPAAIRNSLVPDERIQNRFRNLLLGFLSCLYHQPRMGNRTNSKHSPWNFDSWASETGMCAVVVFSVAWATAARHGPNPSYNLKSDSSCQVSPAPTVLLLFQHWSFRLPIILCAWK